MKREKLKRVIARIDRLPSFEPVVVTLRRLLRDPHSDGRELKDIIMQDPVLCFRVLALVNSAFYSIPGGVEDVRRAISILGNNTLYQLLTDVVTFDVQPVRVPSSSRKEPCGMYALWRHSLTCAIASEAIARHIGLPRPEELFVSGLMHDIGKIFLLTFFEEDFDAVLRHATETGVSFNKSEEQLNIIGHDTMGRLAAKKWGIPTVLRAGIGFHHHIPLGSRLGLPRELYYIADIVSLGNLIAHQCGKETVGDLASFGIPPALLDRIDLTEWVLKDIVEETTEVFERAKAFRDALR